MVARTLEEDRKPGFKTRYWDPVIMTLVVIGILVPLFIQWCR